MVLSLKDIAQYTCIQHAARITDVGETPYRLVRPILKRLNAKQLTQLEETSPAVMPDSDEVWAQLIERDFPDRPFHRGATRGLIVGETNMPHKALHLQYTTERDEFRATSAQRLRRMTEKIQKEKSKNSIIALEGIIREPLIRRRPTGGMGMRFGSRFGSKYGSKHGNKSILGKAMNDVKHRLLIFGGKPKADPYSVFEMIRKPQRVQPQMPRLRQLHQPNPPIWPQSHTPSPGSSLGPQLPGASFRSTLHIQHKSQGLYHEARLKQLQQSPQQRSVEALLRSPEPILNASSSAPSSPTRSKQNTTPEPETTVRKRRPPSIFLNTRKIPRVSRISNGSVAKEEEAAPPKKIAKSSIFH